MCLPRFVLIGKSQLLKRGDANMASLCHHPSKQLFPIILLRQDGAAFGSSSVQPCCETNTEKIVLSSLYADSGCIAIIRKSGITENSFSLRDHKLIFNEICRLIDVEESGTYERLGPWAEQNKIDRNVLLESLQSSCIPGYLPEACKVLLSAQSKRDAKCLLDKMNGSFDRDQIDILDAEQLVGILKNGSSTRKSLPPVKTAWEIINTPPREEETLIGDRFLCVGGGMVIFGPSGVGKSTFVAGFCVAIARGEEYLNVSPARKLKTLVIQAENDDGDLYEQVSGAVGDIGKEDKKNLSEYLKFVTLDDRAGDDFLAALEAYLEQEHPDIVVIDCLHSYLGDSPAESRELSRFLRAGLTPLLRRFKCGCVLIHHTPKATNQKNRVGWTASDPQYLMAGAADLPNWMRCSLMLDSTTESDLFELRAVKRGSRLMWENSDGEPTLVKLIRHSKRQKGVKSPLRWEKADADDVERLSKAQEKSRSNSKSTPTDAQILALLPRHAVGDNPNTWLMSTKEGIKKFREIGGNKNDFAKRIGTLVEQGKVLCIIGNNNAKCYALPDIAEKYRKATA